MWCRDLDGWHNNLSKPFINEYDSEKSISSLLYPFPSQHIEVFWVVQSLLQLDQQAVC